MLHRHRVLSLLSALVCCASGCTRETVVATSGVVDEPSLTSPVASAPPAAASTAPAFGPIPAPAVAPRLPPSAATPAPAARPVAAKPPAATRISGTTNDLLGAMQFIAGDLDADGYDDVLLLAERRNQNAVAQFQVEHPQDWELLIEQSGLIDARAYVFYGRERFPEQLVLADADAVIDGNARDAAPIGDVNGDGFADLLFRSPEFVRIVFGARNRFAGKLDVSTLGVRWDGRKLTQREIIDGAASIFAQPGGDVDADGCDDMIVTVANSAANRISPLTAASDRVYLVKGQRGAWRAGTFDPAWTAAEFAPQQLDVGTALWTPVVAAAGDLDGDGYDDLLSDALVDHDPVQLIFYGGPTAFSGTLSLAQAGARTSAPDPSTGFYSNFRPIGDLDGDGASELAYWRPGGMHVFYGRRERWSGALPVDGEFVVQAGLVSGGEVAWATDVDGDGLPDLLVSRTLAGTNLSGALYLLHGTGARVVGEVSLEDEHIYAESSPTAASAPITARDAFGFGMVANGDVNGDGSDDVLAGAPCPSAQPPRGYVTLIPSIPSTPQ